MTLEADALKYSIRVNLNKFLAEGVKVRKVILSNDLMPQIIRLLPELGDFAELTGTKMKLAGIPVKFTQKLSGTRNLWLLDTKTNGIHSEIGPTK